MNKYLRSLIGLLLISISASAQDYKQIDILYDNALKLYEQKELQKAIGEFEKVIALKPRHKDAIFNLAVINLETGNKDKAIDLLQAAVRLNDRTAADLLKNQLQQNIHYADTMFVEDVDFKPYISVKSAKQEFTNDKSFPKSIIKSLDAEVRKSKVIRKEVEPGKLLALSLYISKEGDLDAVVRGKDINKVVQEEISRITRSIKTITPAKHEGKEVVVWGWMLPVRM